ncbi:signal peptidase II [Tolumonas lignilytica]|jgi:lipoprotein signal peptidase|uniref:signal peptidase II n=1 Tax=Tolumonas lignilytica TaxID=1283284 RepID=UPI000466AC26|nr:signal peptidase II [Tolumonas lignilytica]
MMKLLTGTGLRWLWLAVVTIVLDQLAKHFIMQHIPYGHGVIMTPFFNLVHVYNTGAAFSFLANAEGWQRWLFSGLAVAISGLLVIALAKAPAKCSLSNLAYSLVIGGAIGNLVDRMLYGHVVDFLDFHWHELYHFAAFNVADMAISCGAALIILDGFIKKPANK